MNDQEKSILLAKAMGWEISYWTDYADGEMAIIDPPKDIAGGGFENLYAPANMALAWRVHLWALHRAGLNGYETWWDKQAPWMKEDAQRLWLDRALSEIA